ARSSTRAETADAARRKRWRIMLCPLFFATARRCVAHPLGGRRSATRVPRDGVERLPTGGTENLERNRGVGRHRLRAFPMAALLPRRVLARQRCQVVRGRKPRAASRIAGALRTSAAATAARPFR